MTVQNVYMYQHKNCPECGALLLTDNDYVWCTNVQCTFGINNEKLIEDLKQYEENESDECY